MKLDIEYNTEKPDIQFPEYGRSIQEMIHYAASIPDRTKRQKTVEALINLMIQLGPNGYRNIDDYREKLWNHVFEITNYELDVTPPSYVIIRKEEERPKAEPLGYLTSATRFRHYGNNVHALIKKAIEMPEGSKREGFVEVIASYMKLAYKTWNKEHFVSDDIVKDDLEILSNGKLLLHEGHDSLDKLAKGVNKLEKERTNKLKTNNGRKNTGSGGGRNRNNNNNKNNNNSRNYKKRSK